MPETSTQHVGNGGNPGDFVRDALAGLKVGPRITFEKLTVFPLLRERAMPPAYLTLPEALAEGVLRVTEVSHGGSVPELHVINRSDRPVFILDGEELVGAKQNRVVNLSILVPSKTELNIPVSCVEAGRWTYRSPEFGSSLHAMYASGRARKVDQVSTSLGAKLGRHADQRDVWDGVARQAKLMRVMSPTGAMSDVFTQYERSMDGYVEAFRPADDQVGAVFAIGPRITGFDLFDSPSTMRAYLGKLVRSYALEAIATSDVAAEPPTGQEAERLLETTAQAAVENYPALGLGVDVRMREEKVVGAGLLWENHMVHLNAFTDATAYRAPRRGRESQQRSDA
jgi:hypothetical protein